MGRRQHPIVPEDPSLLLCPGHFQFFSLFLQCALSPFLQSHIPVSLIRTVYFKEHLVMAESVLFMAGCFLDASSAVSRQ